MGLALVMVAAAVTVATNNPLAGLLAASGAGMLVQHKIGFSVDFEGGLATVALVGLKRKTQTLTIGGAKRLWLALTEDILNEFLTYDLAKTAGEFAGAIPMVVGKKFIEIEAWYDTTKFDTEMKIGAGFSQGLEFKVLGFDKDIVRLTALLLDTPVIAVVQGNDDQRYCLGQKYIPLMFEMKGEQPEKGNARKQATFMAKQDGMQVPAFPLASTVTFDVVPLVVVV